MNYKIFSLVALLILATLATPVSAVNVYIDNNPAVFGVLPSSHGYLVVRILAGGSAQDLKVWVIRKGTNTTPFDAYYHPDGTEIAGQNKWYLIIKVQPDGISEPEMLAAGDYIAYLQNGNGNQLETREFTIGNGATERIVFQGSAVARINHTTGTSCIVPAHWEYRFRDWVPEGLEYVWHPEVNHTITVVDSKGWHEYITHPEINHTVHHDEVTREVYHQEINITIVHPETSHKEHRSYTITCFKVLDKKWFNNDGWKVKCSNHAEHGNDWHVQTDRCTSCEKTYSAWSRILPSGCTPAPLLEACIPCYYETRTVVDSEAWEETVVITPARIEIAVVTPAWDEIVVDQEAWIEDIYHTEVTHTEIVVDIPGGGEWVVIADGYWSDWTPWSTEKPIENKNREIGSHWVEKVNNCCCNCNEKKKR